MPAMTGYPAELYYKLRAYNGSRPFDEVVRPWLEAATEQREWLAAFSLRTGAPVPPATRDDLFDLYAQSRLSDLFVLGQTPRVAPNTVTFNVKPITRDEYRVFMETMGFSPIPSVPFTPFFHEIVEVDQAPDADEPISLVGSEFWSGWVLGPMVFARAGVRVRGGANHIVKEIAENSAMYWAYARHNRPACDLSHWWGHNSQWRTEFRRDYLLDGMAWYNVDAVQLNDYDDLEPLDVAEANEILQHRCFVRCRKSDSDLWPYSLKLVEPLFTESM